ncbi:MAG: T9SS type A sorting domain-containing protein [Candidatus Marinimicrobia bacterium]|nr:T9SS type A sorting domain-containing protein [Candidatus Neomarinimicrobiota bacterium]
MKKLVLLIILVCLVSFGFAIPRGHRYDVEQNWESTNINEGATVTFSVEWNLGEWDASQVGYGTTQNGSGWTWVDLPWFEDGFESNRRCKTNVTFSSSGTYYYAYKIVIPEGDPKNPPGSTYQHGSSEWSDNSETLSASNTVTVSEVPTPITLSFFTAEIKGGVVELTWVTVSETENSHFLVYRDGEVIGQIAGNGTCTDPHEYVFLDEQVQAGVHEYAIADVTYGGEEFLHTSVSVEVHAETGETDFVLNKVYPNPFNPTTVISMHYAVGSNAVVNIYNTQGVLVEELVNDFVEAGNYELTWDASGMSSGVYIVRMMTRNTMQSQKIILMK